MIMQNENHEPTRKVSMHTTMMRRMIRAQAETKIRVVEGERWSKVAGLAVFVVGTVVMVGWLLELQAFRRFLNWLVTMKANTALSFLLAGVALWLLQDERESEAESEFEDRHRWLGAGYALVVIVIGLLTFAEYVFGLEIGIDHLIFLPSALSTRHFHAGPMEIEIATNFILIGVALLLMNLQRYRWVVRILIVMVIGICVSSLIGVFSGITLPPGSKPVAPMATLTVATFFLLCVGLLLAGRQFSEKQPKKP